MSSRMMRFRGLVAAKMKIPTSRSFGSDVASSNQKMKIPTSPSFGSDVSSSNQKMKIPTSPSFGSPLLELQRAASSDPPIVVVQGTGTRQFTYYAFHQTQTELKEIVFPPIFPSFGFVVASCGRLVLVQDYDTRAMALLDPSTGKHHIVPPNPAGNTNVKFCGFGGHSLVTIIINHSPGFPFLHLMIYDLNTCTWTQLPHRPDPDAIQRLYKEGPWESGLLLGWAYANNNNCFYFSRGDYKEAALGFDLDRHEFFDTLIPCPSEHLIHAFDGNLCFIDMLTPRGFDFWVTKEKKVTKENNKSCWTRLFSISDPQTRFPKSDLYLDDDPYTDPCDYWDGVNYHCEHISLVPICYSPCRNKVLFEVNIAKLSWYNLETGEFEDFSIGDTTCKVVPM